MKTTTSTQVTHYEIQKKRRESPARGGRGPQDRHQAFRGSDGRRAQPSHSTRCLRRLDGDRPTREPRCDDPRGRPGSTTTIRRHRGTRSCSSSPVGLDRNRRSAHPMATVGHAPSPQLGVASSWKRGRQVGRLPYVERGADLEQFGVALLEEGGDTPVSELPLRPARSDALVGDDPYARRTRRLARQFEGTEFARLITWFDDVRGLVDEARCPEPVHGRQDDRLPHRRAERRHARTCAGPRPVQPPARWGGRAVRDLGPGA